MFQYSNDLHFCVDSLLLECITAVVEECVVSGDVRKEHFHLTLGDTELSLKLVVFANRVWSKIIILDTLLGSFLVILLCAGGRLYGFFIST